ncbi:UDP-Glycosyltransferase/glycogen phosphorylase [Lizonia empirigonia]|nr:UDP-Glycosyltransferase/glycogen phosphorylase [Lizonia empirigonia]
MATRIQEDSHILPTGMVIDEPTFPDIAGDPSVRKELQDPEQSSKNETPQPAPVRRRLQDRSATERPKPSTKHSLLRNIPASRKQRPAPVQRQTTITFDHSSSESDSEDEQQPTDSSSRNETVQQEKARTRSPRKRLSSTMNPFARFKVSNEHFQTKGSVKSDGRLKLSILEEDIGSGYIAKALGAVLPKHGKDDEQQSIHSYDARGGNTGKISPEEDEMENDISRRVKLNIVIIIIGSRGDVQPFIRIGKILKEDYGHRVRIATHPAFKDFVQKDSGLEFFSVGGNPAELMAFMVKNPGLIPNIDTIKGGEIGRRRAQMYEMFQGMWRACINATDDETDHMNAKMMGDKAPFVADAIIANPPSFAPAHIAEKLGIPLHMMFTFPYTPTVHFPHPLANIKVSNVEPTYSNFMSYPLVEMMMWQGLGDLINRFRTQVLRLEDISTLWAPGQLYRLKVPYTYMWSPGIIPKPKDWGPEIDVTGFVFLDLASNFTPPNDLKKFLDNGEPPVYIGFGSIVVDDPDEFTKLIFEAIEMAGVRALVSKGWGGFGSNADCPDNVFMLENTPHDWLFPRCKAVIHHGGAGTTAIGLKCAKPTMIVPFFGDQPFWGAMVSKAKAGAHECIPYKNLTAERLAKGIKECLTEEAQKNVQKIADSIEAEGDGALNAVRSFHRSLPLNGEDSMRCNFLDNRAAAWKIKNTNVKLSALAAEILVNKKKLKWNELRLIRHYEWNDFGGPGEPVTGLWGSIYTTLTDAALGVGSVPVEMGRSLKKREKLWEKKRQHQKKRQQKKGAVAKENAVLDKSTNNSAEDHVAKKEQEQNGRPKPEREESSISKLTEPDETLNEELAHEAAFGFRKTGHALARFPMNITLALTQGFHNAPRLYGDQTVRRPPRVTGLHSGLRAGRDEFVYGVTDGVTGIVTQPLRGAKDRGVMGAVRGVGFGIGGFVLKDIAALLGPTAYFMKGLDAEYMKKYQPTTFIRRGRIAQGQLELQQLEHKTRVTHIREAEGKVTESKENRGEVEDIVAFRWAALKQAIAEEKKHNKQGIIAALTGTSEKKAGTMVPRKGTSVKKPASQLQSKSATTPIAQTEKEAQNKRSTQYDAVKKSLDSQHRRSATLNRSSTEPLARRSWDDTNATKLAKPDQKEKPRSIHEEPEFEETHVLGNALIKRHGPVPSAPETKTGEKQDLKHEREQLQEPGRASADSSSDKTKVGTEKMDWVKMRQEAEEKDGFGRGVAVDV